MDGGDGCTTMQCQVMTVKYLKIIEMVNFMCYIFGHTHTHTHTKYKKIFSTHAFDQEFQLPDTSSGKQKGIHTTN